MLGILTEVSHVKLRLKFKCDSTVSKSVHKIVTIVTTISCLNLYYLADVCSSAFELSPQAELMWGLMASICSSVGLSVRWSVPGPDKSRQLD